MRLINLDELEKFPMYKEYCEQKNGSSEFVYGIETLMEYAQNLPIVFDGIEMSREIDEEIECLKGIIQQEETESKDIDDLLNITYYEGRIEGLIEAKEIISSYMSNVPDINVGNNEWVSADNPPKEIQDVLCQYKNGQMVVCFYEEDGWWCTISDSEFTTACETPQAWKPLPKVYQPEEGALSNKPVKPLALAMGSVKVKILGRCINYVKR